jgi:thioredoxin reductase (NADPH)
VGRQRCEEDVPQLRLDAIAVAAHLASAGAYVTMLIRGDSINKSMSTYLVRQREVTPNVSIRTQVQVVDALGQGQLTGLVLPDHLERGRCSRPAHSSSSSARGLPPTGFKTWSTSMIPVSFSPDVTARPGWTSVSGVFAAGDIRAGSIKRVAAAVAEGSTASMMAREHLMTST